jgi:hypothetical protein
VRWQTKTRRRWGRSASETAGAGARWLGREEHDSGERQSHGGATDYSVDGEAVAPTDCRVK